MEFLSKFKAVSNVAALMIIFVVAYVSAAVTVLVMQNRFGEALTESAYVLLCVMGFMTVMFAASRLIKRTDIVDAAWGPAFVVAAAASFVFNRFELSPGYNIQTIVTILVVIWATRLSYTITRRLLRRPEDQRYVELRKEWNGNAALNAYGRIFVVQAILATIISAGVIHVNLSLPSNLGVFAYIGIIIWIVGFLFEAIGDWQLKQHLARKENKGKLMTSGLWAYTRHPNYFGEATMWWGVFIIVLSTPFGWLGIIGPVVITYLLLFVSGVPMTENAFEGRTGWSAYKKRTSKFFPLPPNTKA
ncbi:DUF1295 domain-containing protein [Candidatus Saccharibacteria bacterium]|nr:DUF1295 domain-containing protein [Candidatus Saccharibacteria bacterium]